MERVLVNVAVFLEVEAEGVEEEAEEEEKKKIQFVTPLPCVVHHCPSTNLRSHTPTAPHLITYI